LRFPCWCVFRPLAEIGDISSPEHAASWANAALAAKNSLTASDAKIVEDAFEQRLRSSDHPPKRRRHPTTMGRGLKAEVVRPPRPKPERADKPLAQGIDKSALACGD
jgi:hypothetical protein